jgi:hypothetical protein
MRFNRVLPFRKSHFFENELSRAPEILFTLPRPDGCAFVQKGHVLQYFLIRIQMPNMPSGSKMMIAIMISPMAMLLKFSSPTVVNHRLDMAVRNAPM